MDFKQKLENYAELIVGHGLNVQKDQLVNLSMSPLHRDFGLLILEKAYKRGAKFVNIDLVDERANRQRILLAPEESLKYTPSYIKSKYQELLDFHGANLKLLGPENPDILSDLPASKINAVRQSNYQAVKSFYEEGIGKSKVHWTLAAVSSPGWAKKIFPNLPAQEATEALWNEIFKICRVDQPDFMAIWKEHNALLKKRASYLNGLNISKLHFEGPETDLWVGLSNRSRFRGGTDKSPLGVDFEPNLPTEECFTTPDWRQTNGTVKATRPVMVNGVLVEDLIMHFANGELTNFEAKSGSDAFKTYIDSDQGGRRLGEVALVGIDSPIYKSGLIFQEILFDENAACHIAVGSAYIFCLENGEGLSKAELKDVGCNESSVHTDIMISSEKVDVTAHSNSGETVLLIEKGQWNKLLA